MIHRSSTSGDSFEAATCRTPSKIIELISSAVTSVSRFFFRKPRVTPLSRYACVATPKNFTAAWSFSLSSWLMPGASTKSRRASERFR